MSYFPFYMDIKNKKCLVIGGGKIAFQKVTILLEFGADVTVISPEICNEIYHLEKHYKKNTNGNTLIIKEQFFQENELEHYEIVVAATSDNDLNTRIAHLCRNKEILVNVVDVMEECSFIFPAIIKKDNLVISISTSGNSPAMAARIKKQIEKEIPDYHISMVDFLGEYRNLIKDQIPQQHRKEFYRFLIQKADEHQKCVSVEELEHYIREFQIRMEGGN